MREVEKNKKLQNNKKGSSEVYRTVHSTIARAWCTSERKIEHRSTKSASLWTEEATVGALASLDYCTQPSAAVQRAPERRILSA